LQGGSAGGRHVAGDSAVLLVAAIRGLAGAGTGGNNRSRQVAMWRRGANGPVRAHRSASENQPGRNARGWAPHRNAARAWRVRAARCLAAMLSGATVAPTEKDAHCERETAPGQGCARCL
jgi:hypothetical protein